MEVHAHSHTERKKWTHYFWEFLMLFLAVFCGFLAENQREHMVEHQRAKQYAILLYEDIKVDTSSAKYQLDVLNFVNPRIDTFINLVQKYKPEELPGGTWYYYGRFPGRYFNITFQDATIQQLKSSGGLRYFGNSSVANAIALYDQACRNLESEINNQNLIYLEVIKWRNQLFNIFLTKEVMDLNVPYSKIDSFKKREMALLSTGKEDFMQFANISQHRLISNGFLYTLYENVFKEGKSLLVLLKKEYHLK
jgi:hypothetical protein